MRFSIQYTKLYFIRIRLAYFGDMHLQLILAL
jgi:hypothetical protein